MYRITRSTCLVEHLPEAERVGTTRVRYCPNGNLLLAPVTEKADTSFQCWVDTKEQARAVVESIIKATLHSSATQLTYMARSIADLDTLSAPLGGPAFIALVALLNLEEGRRKPKETPP